MKEKQNPFYQKWTKSANSRPTIGLTIYGLDNSINISLWCGVIDAAKAYDVNVISFMARDLDSPLGFQSQANVLFDLVSPDRLDGLLIWTVPLINIAGPASVKRIFDRYRSLPIVAIEEGAPEDIPRVVVDSYRPVHDIVAHLIERHGRCRVAFVRGPDETHVGARQRYQGYLDALAEHNLPVDPSLVSPPTKGFWNPEVGEAAISLFLDERGVEFDAVIGVNDAIAIEAMRALQARGVHVPNEVAVVGFDDLDSGTCVIPPLTTVSLQSYEQGWQAVEMLATLLSGNKVPNQVNVPLPLIVRQSCGCISPNVAQALAGPVAVADEQFETLSQAQQDHILAEMHQAASTAAAGLQPEWGNELLAAFSRDLTTETTGVFLPTLDAILRRVVAVNGPLAAWQNVISAFRRSTLPYLANNEALLRAEDLWLQAQVMIGETTLLVRQGQSLQDERRSHLLNEIGSALITTFDVDGLMDVLAQELPRLGIPGCYVSLYENPQQPAGQAKLVLAYDERGRLESQVGDCRFAAPLLIPSEILPQERRYSYVVEALYFREEQLGFALFEEGPHRGTFYYMLREQLSSALKGALLMHQLEEQTMKAEKARESAEKANRAKSAFLANMSHELRTPLNAILGYADILKRRMESTNPLADGLDIIHRSGEHLLTLINDVLDLAKIEAGKLELNPAPLQLPAFLRQIVGIIHARAEAKDLSLTYESLSPLPDVVLADETRLRQVLLNLLGNAVKFTERGHVTLRVSANAEGGMRNAEYGIQKDEGTSAIHHSSFITLHFEVEDTGAGIAPEQLERVFQPFEQAGKIDKRVEGTGLGLAISRQIVQLMGGRLQVESKLGQGSAFWFDVTLPVIEAVAQEEAAPLRAIVGYEGARRKVLVADDKAYNRQMLVDLLEPLGFEVSMAGDGQETIDKALTWQPDAIVMDLVMPVKTGFEAAQEIRQRPEFEAKRVCLIAASASVLAADQEKSRVAGCDAFLPKPIKAERLLDLLAASLGLAWVYAEAEAGSAAPLVPPPTEELAALYQLADEGRILDLQAQAARLEKLGEAYVPFANRLQKLARGFEIDQIKAFLKQFMR